MPILNGLDGFFNGRRPYNPQVALAGRFAGRGAAAVNQLAGFLNATPFGANMATTFSFTGGKTSVVGEYLDHVSFAASTNRFALVFDNFYVTSANGVVGPGGLTRTYKRIWLQNSDRSQQVEVDVGSGFALAPFAARVVLMVTTTWTMAPDEAFHVLYDVDHSSTSGTGIGFWNRMDGTSVTYYYATANRITQTDNAAITPPTGAVSVTGISLGPSWIMAVPSVPASAISPMAFGDSRITAGRDNTAVGNPPGTASAIPMPTGATFYGRSANADASDAATPKNVHAIGRCSTSGATLGGTYSHGVPGPDSLAPLYLGFGNIFEFYMGVNDIELTATWISDMTAMLASVRAAGYPVCIGHYIKPKTGGTVIPAAADGSDQTYDAVGGGAGGRFDQLNAALLALRGPTGFDAINEWDQSGGLLPGDNQKWNLGLTDPTTDTPVNHNLHELPAPNAVSAYEARSTRFAGRYYRARGDTPTSGEYSAYKTFFYKAVSRNSYINKLDALYSFANGTAATGYVNLFDPFGVNTLKPLGNALTFTAGVGFTGNPTTGRLAMTTLMNALTHYTLNDASFGVAVSAVTNGAQDAGGGTNAILSVRTSGNLSGRINSGTSFTFTLASGVGISSVQRTASNASALFKNGSSVATSAVASTNIPAAAFSVFFANSAASSDVINAAWIGSSLTAGEQSDLYTDLKTLINAINLSFGGSGAIIP